MPTHSTFWLFTDGACLGNPGPGGWGVLIRDEAGTEQTFSGGEPLTTNNRMELSALIQGLRRIKGAEKVHVFSDSKYVLDAIRQDWLSNWQKNGWRNAAKKPVKNQDLWQNLLKELARQTASIEWNWVKGHFGHRENEIVDQLASAYASSFIHAVNDGSDVSHQ